MRVALSKIALKTGVKSPGDALMTRSTFAVAFSRSSASSRSRFSSVIFVLALVLEGLRRPLIFGALGRFDFVVVRRRFFMASLSAAGVPIAAMLLPRHREYRKNPAASCSPQGQEMASYRLRPLLWKGLYYSLRRISRQRLSYIRLGNSELSGNSRRRDASFE